MEDKGETKMTMRATKGWCGNGEKRKKQAGYWEGKIKKEVSEETLRWKRGKRGWKRRRE